jgi:gamma-glutamyl:cysteine ligase YbdK (ATP-grasp superfamily)
MNSRVILVSNKWKKRRATLDAQLCDEMDRLAEDALKQAVRLNQLCSLTAKKLEAARDRLGTELSAIGKGAQYLKSVTPAKSNYPKFIDSLY